MSHFCRVCASDGSMSRAMRIKQPGYTPGAFACKKKDQL